MKYRREIDGLRALAVVPVLLFHGGVGGFTGGFVGVDVFFVISGYLITGLILPEIRQGRFSITKFYERRARRILPALFTVMCFTSVIAYYIYLRGDLRDFAHSLVATTLFSSNFLFWSELGYFAAPAEVKPLLHTWSLAVEEQFYILFPLFLLIAQRYFRKLLVPALAIGLIGSLALSALLVDARPDDAFYLPHSRAWELLLGAVLAANVLPALPQSRLADVLAVAGLGLILGSVFFYDRNTPFPGFAGVPPCLGAFLVIWANANQSTWVGRVLGTKAMVGIGLISYSLYLWHWPMLVFAKYYVARPLELGEVAAILLLSFVAAGLSWKLVESPFRGRASPFRRVHIFAGSAVGMLCFAVVGAMGHYTNGFAARPHQALLDTGFHARQDECFGTENLEQVLNRELCTFGEGDSARPDFFVWGDSHANALFPTFAAAATSTGTHGVFAARRACPPLLGVTRPDERQYDCPEFNDAVLELIRTEGVENVFLVARWNVNALGRGRYELATGEEEIFINDEHSQEKSLDENMRTFERGMSRTLERLSTAGVRAFVVLQVPGMDVRVPQYLAARAREGRSAEMRLALESGWERHRLMQDRITAIAARYGAAVVDPAEVLCSDRECLIAKDGYNVYRDDDHLSVKGALLLQPWLEQILTGLR